MKIINYCLITPLSPSGWYQELGIYVTEKWLLCVYLWGKTRKTFMILISQTMGAERIIAKEQQQWVRRIISKLQGHDYSISNFTFGYIQAKAHPYPIVIPFSMIARLPYSHIVVIFGKIKIKRTIRFLVKGKCQHGRVVALTAIISCFVVYYRFGFGIRLKGLGMGRSLTCIKA